MLQTVHELTSEHVKHMLLLGLHQSFKKLIVLHRCCSHDQVEEFFVSLSSDRNSSDLVHLLFVEDLVLQQVVQERSLSIHLLHEECVVVD